MDCLARRKQNQNATRALNPATYREVYIPRRVRTGGLRALDCKDGHQHKNDRIP